MLHFISNSWGFYLCTLLLLLLFSCEKIKSGPDQEEWDHEVQFEIQGVQDVEEVPLLASKASTSAAPEMQQLSKVMVHTELVDMGGFDAVMSITEDVPTQFMGRGHPIRTAERNRAATGQAVAARQITSLSPGSRYRIVLFKVGATPTDLTYVGQREGVIGGSAIRIGTYRNTQYRWYAYSFNNPTAIDTLTPSLGTVPIQPTGGSPSSRQDFAYATGVLTTGDVIGGVNKLQDIVLTRKTSRIIVEINGRGMFSGIHLANPRFGNNAGLIRGNFRLSDSSYREINGDLGANNRASNPHADGYSVPIGQDSVRGLDFKRRYTFYTPSDGVSSRELIVSIDELHLRSSRVREDNGALEDRIRQFNGLTFRFPGFIPKAGKSYFVSIKLVESAITIGTTQWARHNVFRNATGPSTEDGIKEYLFRYDNPLYHNHAASPPNDYFKNDIYSIVRGKNICELIYPENTWDLPTPADFQALEVLSGKRQPMQDNNWSMVITPTVSAAGAPGYPHGNLVFTPVGYKARDGVGEPIQEYNPRSTFFAGTKGYWRTKTPATFAQVNYSLFNTGMIDVENFPETRLANIRCVRKK